MTSLDPSWMADARRQDWRRRAACRGKLHLFYPSGSGHPPDAEAAKALCQSCPVRRECLEFVMRDATSSFEGTGIWAGLNPAERRALRRIRSDHDSRFDREAS